MREVRLGTDVCVYEIGLFGIVTAKFFFDDMLGILKFDKHLDEDYPLWKLKPIYVIKIYDGGEIGATYIAISDILTETAELN